MIPSLIRKEVSDLVYKYLRLLEPFVGNLDYKINDMKKKEDRIASLLQENSATKIDPTSKHKYRIIHDTLLTFITPYERHCKDKNYKIPVLP